MYKIWDSFGSCIMSLLMDSDNRGKKMGTKITGFSCVKAKVRFRGGFYSLIINTKYKTVHTYTCFLKTSIENIVVQNIHKCMQNFYTLSSCVFALLPHNAVVVLLGCHVERREPILGLHIHARRVGYQDLHHLENNENNIIHT